MTTAPTPAAHASRRARAGQRGPKGLLAAAPGDRRIQAAGAIMLGLMAAVWARKATR